MSLRKVIIVTGANSGIGQEAARMLCGQGHEVILACRNDVKGTEAVDLIKKGMPEAAAIFMKLDLSSLDSVRGFATEFKATGKALHALVCNAGLGSFNSTTRTLSPDGFEMTMATNHLGHFLLSNLLLDILKETARSSGEARVVCVTSSLHDAELCKRMHKEVAPLELSNLMMEREGSYNGFQAYHSSKLANVLFTYELSQRLEGSGVTANSMCPGFIPSTGLNRDASAMTRFFMRYFLDGVMKLFKRLPALWKRVQET